MPIYPVTQLEEPEATQHDLKRSSPSSSILLGLSCCNVQRRDEAQHLLVAAWVELGLELPLPILQEEKL